MSIKKAVIILIAIIILGIVFFAVLYLNNIKTEKKELQTQEQAEEVGEKKVNENEEPKELTPIEKENQAKQEIIEWLKTTKEKDNLNLEKPLEELSGKNSQTKTEIEAKEDIINWMKNEKNN